MAKRKDDADPDRVQREKAVTDYGALLEKVRAVDAMTSTAYWADVFRGLAELRAEHARELLTADKPRDVVAHQQGVRHIDAFVRLVRRPIDDLKAFVRECPLFASEFTLQATWNDARGVVELRDIPKRATRKPRGKAAEAPGS